MFLKNVIYKKTWDPLIPHEELADDDDDDGAVGSSSMPGLSGENCLIRTTSWTGRQKEGTFKKPLSSKAPPYGGLLLLLKIKE